MLSGDGISERVSDIKKKLKSSIVELGSSKDLFTGDYDRDFMKLVDELNDSDGAVCVEGVSRNELSSLRYRANKRGFKLSVRSKVHVEGDDVYCFNVRDETENEFEKFVDEIKDEKV